MGGGEGNPKAQPGPPTSRAGTVKSESTIQIKKQTKRINPSLPCGRPTWVLADPEQAEERANLGRLYRGVLRGSQGLWEEQR